MRSAPTSLWKAVESGSGDSQSSGRSGRRLIMLAEEPIDVGDLYEYQRYRWLSGNSEKLAMRYRKFNLQALLDTSVKAVGDGLSCVKLLKCVEGQFNKAFLLTMSNGLEIIARLPNPNAGPAFYTVASEVATRHFLRDKIGIPIPRIYDWSAEAHNSVGAEYILEEKATGQPLGSVWANLTFASQLDIVSQIVDMEKKLASITFPKHGCIYYETDLLSRSLDYEALDSQHGSLGSATSRNDQPLTFVIGPSANPVFWEREKATMNLDRGPWESVAGYATALGKNEIEWATSHAMPRMNFHRSMEFPETSDDYIALVKKYMTLAPYLAASSNIEQSNRISHPDLHLDNIFIDPGTNRITCIIDWQQTSVCPISLHRSNPQMLELSVSSQSDQGRHERKLLDHYYNAVKETDALRWEVLTDPLLAVKTNPFVLVPGCWEREDLFSLRNALITAIARWSDMGHGEIPCPVHFSEEELLRHQDEMDLLEGISAILRELQDEGLIPLGGMVRPQYYERAMELNNHFKHAFIDLAENERQRELHAKVWPYQ
ncbi:hypothetical protein N7468_010357 [Penicillium chermesinum]|uniref:Aminoglycoside phosphotransferase domain-containing protein n=1 Tax=Penicillium chermesinum TaxID=63820 RepID=A0A9W9NCN0_9EURO|nr:uncharacterized protein N7468_010357 [Penicillium chermesinum]KAJ5217349.1 hypothetical protein N7468_010357 [Penicillium chermesinum]